MLIKKLHRAWCSGRRRKVFFRSMVLCTYRARRRRRRRRQLKVLFKPHGSPSATHHRRHEYPVSCQRNISGRDAKRRVPPSPIEDKYIFFRWTKGDGESFCVNDFLRSPRRFRVAQHCLACFERFNERYRHRCFARRKDVD